jgi:hypothetical protein
MIAMSIDDTRPQNLARPLAAAFSIASILSSELICVQLLFWFMSPRFSWLAGSIRHSGSKPDSVPAVSRTGNSAQRVNAARSTIYSGRSFPCRSQVPSHLAGAGFAGRLIKAHRLFAFAKGCRSAPDMDSRSADRDVQVNSPETGIDFNR